MNLACEARDLSLVYFFIVLIVTNYYTLIFSETIYYSERMSRTVFLRPHSCKKTNLHRGSVSLACEGRDLSVIKSNTASRKKTVPLRGNHIVI